MKDKNQRLVKLYNKKSNLLVSASAGAGKTKVLVDRVVYELTPKPHVLSQRPQPVLGIDNFLIVTFTRAAAKEMKQRIQKQLRKMIDKSGSQRIQTAFLRQIGDLPTANIGTLDSFCRQVVEHYYYVIGLDPHFRILKDGTEVTLLRDLVWKSVREALYNDKHNRAFRALALKFFRRHINSDDQLTDPLTNLVFALYNSFKQSVYVDRSHRNSEKARQVNLDHDRLFQAWSDHVTQLDRVTGPLKQSRLYEILSRQMNVKLDRILNDYRASIDLINKYDLGKRYQFVATEYDDIKRVQELSKPDNPCSWDQLKRTVENVAQSCGRQFPRKTKAESKTLHSQIKDYRNDGKNAFCRASDVNSFVNAFFMYDEKDNRKFINASYVTLKELLKVVNAFDVEYTKVKQRRHELEYIDIERAALKILEKSSSVRRHFQRQFHEIMIDEYQDDNQLQDTIIKLVARHDRDDNDTTNVFMVGDVKQSIYRFRSADPRLFKHKHDAYQKADNPNKLIPLSRNYRSTQNVDRFVNLIFNQIMDDRLGGIDYSKEPERFGAVDEYQENLKIADTINRIPVNVMVYDKFSRAKDYAKLITHHHGKIRDSVYGQIEMVAQKIRTLVNNPKYRVLVKNDRYQKGGKNKKPQYVTRPVKYQDIALIASTRNDNVAISDLFGQYGIPVQMLGSQNYFKTTEIQVMLSLLEIIDNPDQDIPLVAVLRSPMVGLNEDQLAYLRINSKTGDYYQAVKKFYLKYPSTGYPESNTGNEIHERIHRFFAHLRKFRKITQRHGLVDLIWSIYQTTGFLDYVGGMPAGVQRQANLHALYERAAQYEQANFHGLFQFVQFIHQLQNQQKDLTDAVPQQGGDVVTSVTIHNSKGREFPVVFLLDTSSEFNTADLKNGYVLSNDLGLGVKYFDRKLHSESKTLPYQCLLNYEKRQDKSEEMRKLYVALTRTEQRLYVVGRITRKPNKRAKYQDPQKLMLSKWNAASDHNPLLLDLANRIHAKTYLEWIGAAIVRQPSFRKRYTDLDAESEPTLKRDRTRIHLNFYDRAMIVKARQRYNLGDTVKLVSKPLKQPDRIKNVMALDYRYQAATREGSYRSVSDVKQLFDDPNNVEMGKLDQASHHDHHGLSNQYVTGDFTTPKFIQSSTQPKATEIGTATHLVLQMVHLEDMKANDDQTVRDEVDATITNLKQNQMIDPNVAKKINRGDICSFFKSWYGRKVLAHPGDYHRETPFSLLLRANNLFQHGFEHDPQSVLIHGIIDGYLHNKKSNDVYLVDYKTDWIDFHNQQKSIEEIKHRYEGQLNLYGKALKSVYGAQHLKFKGLYLLPIHKLVPIGKESEKVNEREIKKL